MVTLTQFLKVVGILNTISLGEDDFECFGSRRKTAWELYNKYDKDIVVLFSHLGDEEQINFGGVLYTKYKIFLA